MNQSGWSTLAATSTASDRSATVMFTPTNTVTTTNPQWFVGERYSANGPLSIWKYDGSTHQNNYVTIGTGGNVGIGTASPATILEVYGPEPAATLGTLLLTSDYNYGFPGGENTGVSIVGRGRYAANLLGSLVAYGKIGMYKEAGSNLTDSYISFFTNRDQDRINGSSPLLSEKMRINSLGYVGIGTATPGANLDVNGSILSTSMSSANIASSYITTGALIANLYPVQTIPLANNIYGTGISRTTAGGLNSYIAISSTNPFLTSNTNNVTSNYQAKYNITFNPFVTLTTVSSALTSTQGILKNGVLIATSASSFTTPTFASTMTYTPTAVSLSNYELTLNDVLTTQVLITFSSTQNITANVRFTTSTLVLTHTSTKLNPTFGNFY
jgi:hypothetical protein